LPAGGPLTLYRLLDETGGPLDDVLRLAKGATGAIAAF
jgi:hypothetical protein